VTSNVSPLQSIFSTMSSSGREAFAPLAVDVYVSAVDTGRSTGLSTLASRGLPYVSVPMFLTGQNAVLADTQPAQWGAGRADRVHPLRAKNDRAKEALFDAAKTGQVQVLLGSTSKMGVGTNAQDRVVALHHVDCPWRPADIIQRDGRGRRQHNQNPEIEILRYVTEGTFDT
jgi:hypothetical protein